MTVEAGLKSYPPPERGYVRHYAPPGVSGTNVNFTITVPTGKIWQILCFFAELTNNDVIGIRPTVLWRDQVNHDLFHSRSSNTINPGHTWRMNWWPCMPTVETFNIIDQSIAPATTLRLQYRAMPEVLMMETAFTISVVGGAFTWGTVNINLIEWSM